MRSDQLPLIRRHYASAFLRRVLALYVDEKWHHVALLVVNSLRTNL